MIQPGEFAKFAAVLAVAAVLSRRDVRTGVSLRRIAAVAGLGGVPGRRCCVLQPDLGNAVLLLRPVRRCCSSSRAWTCACWSARPSLGALGVAVYVAEHPYALDRVIGFLRPWKTAH